MNTISFFLWAAIMVAQVFLAVTLRRSKADHRFPAFCAYVYFGLVAGLFTALATSVHRSMLAFWTYSVCTIASTLLAFMSTLEIYRLVFGPRFAMPEWAPRRVATMISTALGLTLTFIAILRPLNGGPYTRILARGEFGATFILLATFTILFGYSRRLGFTWSTRCRSIAGGFVLYLAVALVARYAIAELSMSIAVIVRQIGMAAYLGSTVWWTCALHGKEKPVTRPTDEEFRALTLEFLRLKSTAGVLGIRTR